MSQTSLNDHAFPGPVASGAAGPLIDRSFVSAGLLVLAVLSAATLVAPLHHDTLEVAMWSVAPWQSGFWKHPPLLPWIIKTASFLIPLGPWPFALITTSILIGGA